MSQQGIYSGGFVVNIISGEKMQQIAKDNTVTIQFESEYKIRLQNKNSRRAVAKIFIDDENISGEGFVINAYSQVDIERPVDKQFKFKLVRLDSAQAADAGKSQNINGEKGTIRVEFQLEKEVEPIWRPPVLVRERHPWRKDFIPPYEPVWGDNSNELNDAPTVYSMNDCEEGGEVKTCGGILESKGGGRSFGLTANYSNASPASYASKSIGETGATVSGGKSNVNYHDVYVDLENKPPVVISLLLRGWDESTLPVLDGNSVYCSSCGKKATRRTDKFCTRCGNKLS